MINQIEKIEKHICNLKATYNKRDFKELFKKYVYSKKILEDLNTYIEIDAIENGLIPEEEFIIDFPSFLNYILKGSQSILLEVPKNLFNCSSPAHIKKLLEQSAILTCKKDEYIETFILTFSINSNAFQEIYKNIAYSTFQEESTYHVNITYQDGKKLINTISKFAEENYIHSLNVKCK